MCVSLMVASFTNLSMYANRSNVSAWESHLPSNTHPGDVLQYPYPITHDRDHPFPIVRHPCPHTSSLDTLLARDVGMVWYKLPPVASTGSILKYRWNCVYYYYIVYCEGRLNNQALGARDGIRSNLFWFATITLLDTTLGLFLLHTNMSFFCSFFN